MKILFLAPQPFFQERGTPIAVRLALEVLTKRTNQEIHLLTYGEGIDVSIPGVTHYRIWTPRLLRGVGPGASIKKLLLDLIFFCSMMKILFAERRSPYHLVHAVEESVFMAMIAKFLFGTPYLYDMDSSLSLQLTDKWAPLKPLRPVLEWIEACAIRSAAAVVPVCDALAEIAKPHNPCAMQVLHDISFFDNSALDSGEHSLRAQLGIGPSATLFLYIGNLEKYQGIDLLLESFSIAIRECQEIVLVIIGGSESHVARYNEKATSLGLRGSVWLLGSRPVTALSSYLMQADVLVSPRTAGNNTPMKIYSYLHSGVPVLATRLFTHTQVMDDSCALLADPNPESFGAAIARIASEPSLRSVLGENARAIAEKRYTYPIFEQSLNSLYDQLSRRVMPAGEEGSLGSIST